jgi:hypothetical protein
VQALLNRYETFDLSTGHTVKLPPDRGEGQQWNRKPGNPYSEPLEVRIDPSSDDVIRITMDRVIPPIEPPDDTEWVKHIRIQSDRLTEFYGTPMYLGAHVLLPAGFDTHPDARYPLVINHGHFPADLGGWRTEPPDTTVPCVYSARFDLECYNRIQDQAAYQFFRDWTGPDFPRVLLIEIQHPTPYYDDSYAVNSASQGPWGDAIMFELVPEIERRFRGIGEGWARFTYGGSTGGWEAMAVQVLYPDEFNGAWVACPDPIDFRAYTVVNIYEDENAYFLDSRFKRTPRPGRRDWLGHVGSTLEEMNHLELVLGTHSRSGQTVGHMGGDVFAAGSRRLSTSPVGQAYRRDRSRCRGILARELRSVAHPASRLEQRTRREARRKTVHLRRRHGQLLPQQRGPSHRGVPRVDHEPVLCGRSRLRRSR